MDTRYKLDDITKEVVRLAIEKRLYDSLKDVAGDLPNEVLDKIYINLYKPVMVNIVKVLNKVIWK